MTITWHRPAPKTSISFSIWILNLQNPSLLVRMQWVNPSKFGDVKRIIGRRRQGNSMSSKGAGGGGILAQLCGIVFWIVASKSE